MVKSYPKTLRVISEVFIVVTIATPD